MGRRPTTEPSVFSTTSAFAASTAVVWSKNSSGVLRRMAGRAPCTEAALVCRAGRARIAERLTQRTRTDDLLRQLADGLSDFSERLVHVMDDQPAQAPAGHQVPDANQWIGRESGEPTGPEYRFEMPSHVITGTRAPSEATG